MQPSITNNNLTEGNDFIVDDYPFNLVHLASYTYSVDHR